MIIASKLKLKRYLAAVIMAKKKERYNTYLLCKRSASNALLKRTADFFDFIGVLNYSIYYI
jgi:hypothetical protein